MTGGWLAIALSWEVSLCRHCVPSVSPTPRDTIISHHLSHYWGPAEWHHQHNNTHDTVTITITRDKIYTENSSVGETKHDQHDVSSATMWRHHLYPPASTHHPPQ